MINLVQSGDGYRALGVAKSSYLRWKQTCLKFNPQFPSQRIFSTIYRQKMSKMSSILEKIRVFREGTMVQHQQGMHLPTIAFHETWLVCRGVILVTLIIQLTLFGSPLKFHRWPCAIHSVVIKRFCSTKWKSSKKTNRNLTTKW